MIWFLLSCTAADVQPLDSGDPVDTDVTVQEDWDELSGQGPDGTVTHIAFNATHANGVHLFEVDPGVWLWRVTIDTWCNAATEPVTVIAKEGAKWRHDALPGVYDRDTGICTMP